MKRWTALAAAIVAAGSLVAAQAPSQPSTNTRLAFDVASIKRSTPDQKGGSIGERPGGRWAMANVAIVAMIKTAYPTPAQELAGAPDWVNNDRYDVTAKVEGTPTRAQFALMLQSLLADRFKLVAHYETRDQSVFALTLARSDRRLGPDLILSKVDCDAVTAARRAGRTPDGPRPANGAAPCGYQQSGGTLMFGGLPMSRLADWLGEIAGRPVLDKTGLAGNYEFTLKSTADVDPAGDVPSLFAALQEQLGLKLVSDRAPLQMLIVDHIERPTED